MGTQPGTPDGGTIQLPRSENSLADSLSTEAILNRVSWEAAHTHVQPSPGCFLVGYFDGGSREENRHSGAGCVLILFNDSSDPIVLSRGSYYLGPGTNNEAEATAVLILLRTIVAYLYKSAGVVMDGLSLPAS